MDSSKYYDVAKELWKIDSNVLSKLDKFIDPKIFNTVTEAIIDCNRRNGRIFLAGKGISGTIAKLIAHTLCCVDIPAAFVSVGEGINASMGLIKKGDLIIMFSKGGNTEEIISMIQPCRKKDVKVIGVTSNPTSKLAFKSDIMLRIAVDREVAGANSLATAVTIAIISTFNSIAITIQENNKYI